MDFVTFDSNISRNNGKDGIRISVPSGADFNLSASSPCIDTGITALSPTQDYAGTARPKGAGVDIGAYESF